MRRILLFFCLGFGWIGFTGWCGDGGSSAADAVVKQMPFDPKGVPAPRSVEDQKQKIKEQEQRKKKQAQAKKRADDFFGPPEPADRTPDENHSDDSAGADD